jgi:hypothetical protein
MEKDIVVDGKLVCLEVIILKIDLGYSRTRKI